MPFSFLSPLVVLETRKCLFAVASGQSMAVPTSKKKVQDKKFGYTEHIQHWQDRTVTTLCFGTSDMSFFHQIYWTALACEQITDQRGYRTWRLFKCCSGLRASLPLPSIRAHGRAGVSMNRGRKHPLVHISHCWLQHEVKAQVIFRPSKPQNFHLFSRLAPTPLSSCLNVFWSRVMRTSTSAVQICEIQRKMALGMKMLLVLEALQWVVVTFKLKH